MNTRIVRLNTRRLRDGVHVQFYTDLQAILGRHGTLPPGVEAARSLLEERFLEEIPRFNAIRYSTLTAELVRVDHEREELYRGLVQVTRGRRKDPDPTRAAAARVTWFVISAYRDITRLPYDEQTILVERFCQEFTGARQAALETLGLDAWLASLDETNNRFRETIMARYHERGQRLKGTMQAVRESVDEAYRALVERVEAEMLVNPGSVPGELVHEWNVLAKTRKDDLARARGRREAREQHEQQTSEAAARVVAATATAGAAIEQAVEQEVNAIEAVEEAAARVIAARATVEEAAGKEANAIQAVEEAAARVVATREAVEEAAGKKAVARATVKEVIARVISARGRQREESRGRDEPGNNNETKRVRRKWLVRGKVPAGT